MPSTLFWISEELRNQFLRWIGQSGCRRVGQSVNGPMGRLVGFVVVFFFAGQTVGWQVGCSVGWFICPVIGTIGNRRNTRGPIKIHRNPTGPIGTPSGFEERFSQKWPKTPGWRYMLFSHFPALFRLFSSRSGDYCYHFFHIFMGGYFRESRKLTEEWTRGLQWGDASK